eukprot:TRINITY_DN88489_c0_g1_i1.p1 TRINITY_DN88489_c0_g1~~TRINITY_DN88489_c0_g1_i1.p1  ORF type:complete len:385 (+),score=33.45 TRINITY_DN88489_c0_g1_i1:66-1157(+)
MSDRVRAKMRRVEEFLENQKRRHKSVKSIPIVPKCNKMEKRLVNRLKNSVPIFNKGSTRPSLVLPKLDIASLRARFFPPQPAGLSTARATFNDIVPGSIVKNGFMSQRDSVISKLSISGVCPSKHVTFSKNEAEVYLVKKYINDSDLEYFTDIEELQEAQEGRELFAIARSQIEAKRKMSLGAFEAILEKIYGDLKRNQIEPESSEKPEAEEISRLSILNSTLQNEINSLRFKELSGKWSNEPEPEHQFSFEKSTKESIATVTKPQEPTKNSSWLKTWSMVEAFQSKIVYGSANELDVNEFEKTLSSVSGVPEEPQIPKKSVLRPEKVKNLQIECSPQKESFYEPVTVQLKVICKVILQNSLC